MGEGSIGEEEEGRIPPGLLPPPLSPPQKRRKHTTPIWGRRERRREGESNNRGGGKGRWEGGRDCFLMGLLGEEEEDSGERSFGVFCKMGGVILLV